MPTTAALVTQLYQSSSMLIDHVAVQVLRVACLVLTELAQVLFVAAVLLEVQVELTAGGELHVTLLAPVKVVAEVGVRNVLAEVLKDHCLIVTVLTDVGVFFMKFGVFNEKHISGKAFLTHATHIRVSALVFQDHMLL